MQLGMVIGGESHETVEIALHGQAHREVEPTAAEKAARAEERGAEARKAAEAEAHEQELQRMQQAGLAAERRDPEKKLAFLERKLQMLEALADVRTALVLLFNSQADGVEIAYNNAAHYRKRPPKPDGSLLFALARAALEIATAGIATRVAASVTKALAVSSEAVQSSLEMAFELGAKAFVARLSPGDDAGDIGLGGNALNDYFECQLRALRATQVHRTELVVRELRRLEPYLHAGSDMPIEAARAVERAATAEIPRATTLQADRSMIGWVQAVSQPTTVPRETSHVERLPPIRGVLDIVFDGVPEDPNAPATVVSATLNGISQEVANSLVRRRLLTSIPIRAQGTTDGRHGSMPVIVQRSPTGELEVVDWLGYTRGKGRGNQLVGARKLIEQELVPDVARRGIATDDGTGTGG